jgi:hypothetical protein
MGYVAPPNYASWVLRYPEFTGILAPIYELYFAEAGLFCRNDGSGPVTTAAAQSVLMQMLTAHIAALYSQSQGDPNPGTAKNANTPVGRITDATQGSVSVSLEWPSPADASAMEKWLTQTKYGAEYWAATLVYRQARYCPGLFYSVPGGGPRGLYPFFPGAI